MIGKTRGNYQIVEKLGAGGACVVYRARDAHPDRFVAILSIEHLRQLAEFTRGIRGFIIGASDNVMPGVLCKQIVAASEAFDTVR